MFSDYFDSLFDLFDYYFDRFDSSLNVLVSTNIMPKIISPDEKISVIGDWLDGETREDIASKHNMGSGTVYIILFMNGAINLVLKKQMS